MSKTIVLIGMMGSGKTSVGKELAKSLGIDFVDSDSEIEQKCKKTIREIFDLKGENYFRKIEEKICIKLINGKPKVVSIGGGAFINKNIRKIIKSFGTSIWIHASIDTIHQRLSKSKNKRPMLNYVSLKNSIKNIYDKRKGIYETADYTIRSKNDNKKVIVKKILEKYENTKS